ncbi:CARDB domain-containing protein [Haloprofundus halophilus]|uniref:CARDB domain-containing protein n=1 Tax=Haloprofundus halophilus TaxID=2283527 RepID=UPI000E42FBC8|nr:CARDB domain-containing protein [Haloprofundus halophilus]
MSSDGITQLVLFIAALTVAAGVATTLTTNVSDISSSLDTRGDSIVEGIDTDVEIISDPGSPDSIYDSTNQEVTLLVKNTGERTLSTDRGIDVLVDGQFVAVSNVEIVSGASAWRPGQTVSITVSKSLAAGEHRAVVRVDGDSAELLFYI